ncbi:putative uncharacterized protein [Blautia hydrogenotrophica CAG:147]|uniref:rhomboid family intramembrane serine protease n=1 Tax=Blautia hydrogenotrophica TaxID=53443 RepID=UPI00034091A7|nr:rhomboid family intramembrane serine protease [Blautia hydrogenotrophica]CCX59911.1 putative uncharacterized protein [Blautia hydrogenotrophica CAG:147]
MKIINKLERKFGRFGIPHLTNYILVCYVIGYLLSLTNTSLISYLYLEPGLILRGQIWRLITWVLVPPGMSNILFVLIMLMFYYSLGTTLERTWGTFRYTLYIISGLVFTVIGAFLLYFIEGGYIGLGGIFSTYYISMSIFLAFAASYPDMKVLLYFVIPIKMKWMAFVYVAMIGYDIFNYVRMGVWQMAVPIVASLLNFIIFFMSTRDVQRYHPKEIKRRQEFKKAVNPTKVTTITKHKCAICGRTERDGENLEFRFCSKCNGNYEYCQDHLYTHEHVK